MTNITVESFKLIVLMNTYRTDILGPRLKSPTKQVIVDHVFSRTVMIGEETCKISHGDLQGLTGISKPTISRAMRELIKDSIIVVKGAYGPRKACEYSLNIRVPERIETIFAAQRNPWLLIQDIEASDRPLEDFELTTEGFELISAIRGELTSQQAGDIENKAREELSFLGQDLSQPAIEKKIIEILLRNFSEEKRKRCIKHLPRPVLGKEDAE